MKRRALAAWALLTAAGALIVAGVAGYDLRAAAVTAGLLLLLVLFGPDVT